MCLDKQKNSNTNHDNNIVVAELINNWNELADIAQNNILWDSSTIERTDFITEASIRFNISKKY